PPASAQRAGERGHGRPVPPFGTARRVRRPSGPPSCESGAVVSLLARLPRRGGDGGPRTIPLAWLAVAAILAVDVAGLAGLGLAVVVVQTLDPSGGLPFGGARALAAPVGV